VILFSMCTSEFFAFEATWSPSRSHCYLSSAASTFGQGWVKCADGELQIVAEKRESSSIRHFRIPVIASPMLHIDAYCFTFFLGQPLNQRLSAIYNVAWDFRADLFTNLSLPKKDLERFESDDVQAMLSEDVREIRPMIMMFRCSRKGDTVDLGPWVVKKV
jgi:hypothetical protein